jgi:hypothetical protein
MRLISSLRVAADFIMSRPKVFFDVTIGGQSAGRITFE